jgi:hypothetical protein
MSPPASRTQPAEDPRRGEHNELGLFTQDEERAADETPGQEEQE